MITQYMYGHQIILGNISVSNIESENIATGNFLSLKSASAILMEQKSGTILYEHNSHEKLSPASVTKVMTLLLIMEALDNGLINLNDPVPCSEFASKMGGSQIWLDTTETLTVHEMIKAIAIVSANEFAHHNHVMQKSHTKH